MTPCTEFWSGMRLQGTVMSFMTSHNDVFLWRAAGACCVTDACMGNAQDLTRPAHYASHGKASLSWNPNRLRCLVFELISAVVLASLR